MKGLALVMSALLMVEALALKPIYFQQPKDTRTSAHVKQIRYLPSRAARVGLDLCPACIDFTDQAINTLLNIILSLIFEAKAYVFGPIKVLDYGSGNSIMDAGIIGSCGALCELLEEKTGSKALGAICDILCDIAGIEEFIKLIEKADLDPIYFCELLKACPIFDGGDAKITVFAITPKSGPQGTEFVLEMEYVSVNGTGTGEISLGIGTVDGIPLGDSFLNQHQPPGSYEANFKIDASPDPNCDPTQEPCEQWEPGLYNITVDICNGECGSKHPHSKIYARATTNFTLTG